MDYRKYEELKKELQKLDLTPSEYEEGLKDITELLEM